MRLTQINLAGFKSFVDPVHIPVPGQLVGIVGPNGCGKSNIIDAVRWVLGETSARHLRGATMQDVLFNGSGNRKPANRASVELLFDNSLGKAAGQWSSYGEIAVKRVIERDGDSSYYINNIAVRRRDVADIFLGTGLGARAYAIIEQGMISRVIEAKPEELRVFLEEAAGVSKYRERRRETELRLRDTRENLQRVDDIRQELAKQIEHLHEQAEVAKKYHELQSQLTVTQHLLWYTRRQEARNARNRHLREIERAGVELEAETAKLRDAEKRLEELRSEHYRAGDTLHACQGALYETNAEVARLEQQITHVRENRSRIEHQISSLRSQHDASQSQLILAQRNLDEARQEETRAAQQVIESTAAVEAENQKLPVSEEHYRSSYARREELQKEHAQTQQLQQVEQTKIVHTQRLVEQLDQRRIRLEEERNGLPSQNDEELSRLKQTADDAEALFASKSTLLEAREKELPGFEQAARLRQEELDAAGQKLAGTEARIHALTQLQEKLSKGADMEGWLASRNLDKQPRLWQGIEIEPGWEDALEAVLRERLNGIAVDHIDQGADWLSQSPPGKMTVISAGQGLAEASTQFAGLTPLTQYVRCRDQRLQSVVQEWLHGVYVVQNTQQGMTLRSELPVGALLVSGSGYVFTRHSVSFHAPDTELHGVLSRQREIEKLAEVLGSERSVVETAKNALAAAEQQIEKCRNDIVSLRSSVTAAREDHHRAQIESLRAVEQAQRASARGEQIAAELAEAAEQIIVEAGHRAAAETVLAQLTQQSTTYAGQAEESAQLCREAEAALSVQRETLQKVRHAHQESLFSQKTIINKIKEIENSIALHAGNISTIETGITEAQNDLSGYDEVPWQTQLQSALAIRVEREQALTQARDALEGMESRLHAVEQERLECEQKLGPLRERINEVKLKEQEARLTEEQYAQQLAEAGANDEELAALLEKGTRSGAMQSEINRLSEEIRALGAVNLAALEELQSAQERRDYLDAQSRDLTEAMTTLEDAIKRIDRETRERLQATFDQVSRHFSEIFPTLFGGGNAKLTLTGEEILDCGVHVMAQPPGKKNSTIHLLSGGEKALTALSLVFALFQLNPAPFCLLDEVDAPLDDHNTERFCDLVKKMSGYSQFLFISHNKITMEIANQLLGITMQEAGVSRVVAVDIEEAMKLSEAA